MNQSTRSPVANVSLIVAISRNGVIGRDGGLPWRLPEDLRRFKSLTMGHHIIMGRRTFESLGRCLPGRTNVVVSRSDVAAQLGATVVRSVPDALAVAIGDKEPFIIGGAKIFEAAWPQVTQVYLTRVLVDVDGDTRLDLRNLGLNDPTIWSIEQTSAIQYSTADKLPFQFQTFQRLPQAGGVSRPPNSLATPNT